MKVFYDNDGITELFGEWFDLTGFEEGSEYLDDITSVITGLKSPEMKKEIIEAEFSYYVSEDVLGGKYVSAIPAYVFKMSDGEMLIIDARTGKNVKENREN